MDEKFENINREEIFSYSEDIEHIVDEEEDISAFAAEAVKPAHSKATAFAYDWLKSMLFAVSVVVLILSFAVRLVTIDGDSMNDTLINLDRAILTTFNYTPQNGDIVAIAHGGNLNKTIIKRIIATAGQTIKIDYEKAQVIVDGVILNEPYIKDPTTQQGNWDIPEVIPEGYVFVMGDNRRVSLDSRNSDVGLIPVDDIIGKAQVVISPFSHIKYLY